MLGTMLGAACLAQKMLGVHVRCTGVFPLKKNKLKDITQQYILQQNKTVYIKNTYFHKSPVFK